MDEQNPAATIEALVELFEAELSALHAQQLARAAGVARTVRPGLTAEDLLNPDNFPGLIADPRFMYEDGQAAGILSAKIAVRALFKRLLAAER